MWNFLWRKVFVVLICVGALRLSACVGWRVNVVHNSTIEIYIVVHICDLSNGLLTNFLEMRALRSPLIRRQVALSNNRAICLLAVV